MTAAERVRERLIGIAHKFRPVPSRCSSHLIPCPARVPNLWKATNKFTKLLQIAQSLNFGQYNSIVADNFNILVADVRELDAEGYAKKAVDSFKKLLHKGQQTHRLSQFR